MCLGLCGQLCVRVSLVCPGVGSSPPDMGPAYSLSLSHLCGSPQPEQSRQADELGQGSGWGLHGRLWKGLMRGLEQAVLMGRA